MRVIFNRNKEESTKGLKKVTEFNDFDSIKKLRKLQQEFWSLDALLENEVKNHMESKANE